MRSFPVAWCTLLQPTYALVMTTYGWDRFVQSQYDRNVSRSRSGDPYIVVDETKGTVATPYDSCKISATPERAETLGLRIAYDRSLFWHNLDYLYYIFYSVYSAYDYYVFLDYDAVVDADIDDIIERMHGHAIDCVAEPVPETVDEWVYSKPHRPIYGSGLVKGVNLAITILSKRALHTLYERRVALSLALPSDGFWPFCEGFVANECKIAGFRHAALREFGSTDRFSWWPPTLEDDFVSSDTNAFVHPVLDRPRYISSMVKHSSGLHFVSPASRLWTSMLRHPDKFWLNCVCVELWRRLRRKARAKAGRDRRSIGMNWT